MKFLQAVIIMFFMLTLSVQASEAEQAPKKETPITQWIAAENKVLASMPEANQRVFFILRNKHSVIRSIEMVQRDVGNAVKACAKENPELKKDMTERFKEWNEAVNPILKNARDFLKTELKEQDAFHASDFAYVTKLNDKAFEYSEKQIEKKLVTTPDACKSLRASMDDTEDQLINLLQDILLPEEVIQKRVERAEDNSN